MRWRLHSRHLNRCFSHPRFPTQPLLWITLLLLTLHFARFTIHAAHRTSHSYIVLYTSAQLLREGVPVNRFYDDRWFNRQTARYDDLYRDIYRPHSPITALMLLPLSDLDYAKSRVIWTMFNVAFLLAASFRLLRELKVSGVYLSLMLLLILLYDPLHVNLELGQSYILMFTLSVIAWVGYRRGDERALGIALGLMLALKTAGLFLWPLLIVQRRWSALIWGMVTVTALALASLPVVGLDAWLTYVQEVGYFRGQPWLAVTAYQTPTSLFYHLFTYHAEWNPHPVLIAPALASALTSLTTLCLVGLTLMAGLQRRKQADLTFAAFSLVSLLIVPLALDYHYMLLLLPILILVAQPSWSVRAKLALILAIVLVSTAIDFRQPALSVGWWALLAYPKLYGALLLWALTLWQIYKLTRNRRGVKLHAPALKTGY
jgi:hypothetical protein